MMQEYTDGLDLLEEILEATHSNEPGEDLYTPGDQIKATLPISREDLIDFAQGGPVGQRAVLFENLLGCLPTHELQAEFYGLTEFADKRPDETLKYLSNVRRSLECRELPDGFLDPESEYTAIEQKIMNTPWHGREPSFCKSYHIFGPMIGLPDRLYHYKDILDDVTHVLVHEFQRDEAVRLGLEIDEELRIIKGDPATSHICEKIELAEVDAVERGRVMNAIDLLKRHLERRDKGLTEPVGPTPVEPTAATEDASDDYMIIGTATSNPTIDDAELIDFDIIDLDAKSDEE